MRKNTLIIYIKDKILILKMYSEIQLDQINETKRTIKTTTKTEKQAKFIN